MRIFYLAFASFIMAFVMAFTGNPLKAPATPAGIINLELANNVEETRNIIGEWQNRKVRDDAKLNTYLDFIFLFFYSLFFFSVCKWLSKRQVTKWKSKLSSYLAAAALWAGVFDIMENTGMMMSLNGMITAPVIIFTLVTSLIKWILVLLVILWIIFSVAGLVYKKFTRPSIN